MIKEKKKPFAMTEKIFIEIVESYLDAARDSNIEDCCLVEEFAVVSDDVFDEAYMEIARFYDETAGDRAYRFLNPHQIGTSIWRCRNFYKNHLFDAYPKMKETAERMGMRFATKTAAPENNLIIS